MSIVKLTNRKTGTVYVYQSESYWDKEKKQPRNRRKLLGKLDADGNLIPTKKSQADGIRIPLLPEENNDIQKITNSEIYPETPSEAHPEVHSNANSEAHPEIHYKEKKAIPLDNPGGADQKISNEIRKNKNISKIREKLPPQAETNDYHKNTISDNLSAKQDREVLSLEKMNRDILEMKDRITALEMLLREKDRMINELRNALSLTQEGGVNHDCLHHERSEQLPHNTLNVPDAESLPADDLSRKRHI